MNIGKVLKLSWGSLKGRFFNVWATKEALWGSERLLQMGGVWEKQLTTGNWNVQSPEVLFLSTPKLSNADQEREAGGVHGIDLALRDTT